MGFSRSDNLQRRRERVREYGSGIKNHVPILPDPINYEIAQILEARGVEIQTERQKEDFSRREIAHHVCGYWGMNFRSAEKNVMDQIESGFYFTRFLVPIDRKMNKNRLLIKGVPIASVHTTLRTADYLALLGYNVRQQKDFFEKLKKGIPDLLFAPSPLQPYERESEPLGHVSLEDQLKERGLL